MKTKALSLFLCALCGVLTSAEPFIDKQDLFTAGEDPAYNIYHIPGIVVTAKGSVLAWCEARKRPAGVTKLHSSRAFLCAVDRGAA